MHEQVPFVRELWLVVDKCHSASLLQCNTGLESTGDCMQTQACAGGLVQYGGAVVIQHCE
jgi:hypothetical protein